MNVAPALGFQMNSRLIRRTPSTAAPELRQQKEDHPP
jgi:hypothetical protein